MLGYTIAAEIGDIDRFPTPKKLIGYTGLCPTVDQSGGHDWRGSLAKNGPKHLRWALIEAATHPHALAAGHPAAGSSHVQVGRPRRSAAAGAPPGPASDTAGAKPATAGPEKSPRHRPPSS